MKSKIAEKTGHQLLVSGPRQPAGFRLVRGPMKPGQCPDCATVHDQTYPHNQQSMFWQYSFYEKNGRFPTWEDAMAHCTPEMKKVWIASLAERGVVVSNVEPA